MNTLRQAVDEYLTMRRGLGFKLHKAGKCLPDFAAYMERRRVSFITQSLALAWAQKPRNVQPVLWASRLNHVRQFARYRSASDPRTQIPAPGLLPFRPKRARPYLYTDAEIKKLLQSALQMPLSLRHRRNGALLPCIYYCLFGLLSVSGLRLSEACNLELEDVDLKAGILTIRGAKFGKDRWVALHVSTCKVLAEYLDKRQRHWAGGAASSYFFVSSRGNRLDEGQIRRAFYAASRRIGLRGAHDRHGPRLHDLRHRFATTTLVNWYRSNQDPERRLPVLSTFLGHVHIEDTQWYLSGSPALMREAMRRLEHRWETLS
jgi:integrase/recombinase XerD